MNNGMNAVWLLGGLFVFLGIAVVGPVVGDAADRVFTAAVRNTTGEAAFQAKKIREYNAEGNSALSRAYGCCSECAQLWDYRHDACDPQSQVGNECVLTCTTAEKATGEDARR